VLIRVRDESRFTARIRLDGRGILTTRERRTRISVDPDTLSSGPHRLLVSARDAAGNLGRTGTSFRVCN
jgi:hypothetical protein